MIEQINLSTYKIISNYVLIKIDPAYDFLVIDGPGGKKIELQIVAFAQDAVNHVSISGTVITMPEQTFFFEPGTPVASFEFASCMKESLDADCKFDFTVGDKVFFNYNAQLSAELENRLVETVEHGICMLINLNTLFGYQHEKEIIPVNGYVFFIRDQEPERIELNHGIIGLQEVKKYGSLTGTVINADAPVVRYLDGSYDPECNLVKGDKIVLDKRFGYRVAYELHAGQLDKVEIIFRKHILAKLVA